MRPSGRTLDQRALHPRPVDATDAHTDAKSFELLRPAADAFRNFYSDKARLTPTQMMVDQADTLTLTVPEMTVLLAGMRMLDANSGGARHGVFTDTPGSLSNDFFVNLLDMGNTWKPTATKGLYEAATARPARSNGPRPKSIWCSVRTPSCAPWPRPTP